MADRWLGYRERVWHAENTTQCPKTSERVPTCPGKPGEFFLSCKKHGKKGQMSWKWLLSWNILGYISSPLPCEQMQTCYKLCTCISFVPLFSGQHKQKAELGIAKLDIVTPGCHANEVLRWNLWKSHIGSQ